MKRILIISCIAFLAFTSGDEKYPQEYFALPVNRAIKLSGTFGELRSNHFHAGIDIKTLNGRPGEKVFASARGYIARVKVEPGGYGNALYIAHPNGYTTVYAHLDRFTPEIETYVASRQHALQRFRVDLHPKPDQFQFDQGDQIGNIGNSGSSFGPHLHFEIRRSSNQVPINPFLFGLPLQDKVRPDIQALNVYHLDDEKEMLELKTYSPKRIAIGQYVLSDTLTEAAWRVGFALKTIDKMDGTPNSNGVYAITTSIDGEVQFDFSMNEIGFDVTRYLNAHLDFTCKAQRKGSFHRCYKVPGNQLNIYDEYHDKGIVALYSTRPRKVQMEVIDAFGNTSVLTFYIKRSENIPERVTPTHHFVAKHDQSLSINTEDLTMDIPVGTFYERAFIEYTKQDSKKSNRFAQIHTVGTEDIAMHKYARISIRSEGLPGALKSKAFLAKVSDDGTLVNCGGRLEGIYVTSSVRSLGEYTVGVDTIAPSVKAVTFTPQMQGRRRMQFRITDSQPISGRARGLRYHASVDGKWILMKYDAKNDLITHDLEDNLEKGEHTLRIVVTDDRNNTTTYERTFTR